MAKRRTDSNRRDLATWLMMLLPGFMFVGLLAPAAVNVKPKAQEEIGPISFRNFSPRRPIQFSLPNVHGALSESGLQPMFAGARYIVDQAKRVAEFDFKADENEQIVLNEDSVESYVAETLFEAQIEDPQHLLVVDLDSALGPVRVRRDPRRDRSHRIHEWDDFHGTSSSRIGPPPGNVIPEPATGGLLAIGLAALAMRRKRA